MAKNPLKQLGNYCSRVDNIPTFHFLASTMVLYGKVFSSLKAGIPIILV